MAKVGEWVHAPKDENYVSIGFKTRERAVDHGLAHYEGAEFYVAQVTASVKRASQLAEGIWGVPVGAMFAEARSYFPDTANGWPACTPAQQEELQNTLRVKIDQWADTHGKHPNFCKVDKAELVLGGAPVPVVEETEDAVPVWVRDNDAISGRLLSCGVAVNPTQVGMWSDLYAEEADVWAMLMSDGQGAAASSMPGFLTAFPTRDVAQLPEEPAEVETPAAVDAEGNAV